MKFWAQKEEYLGGAGIKDKGLDRGNVPFVAYAHLCLVIRSVMPSGDVSDCFCTTEAELSSYCRDHVTHKV